MRGQTAGYFIRQVLLDTNWASIIDALLATDGDTTYEALTCIGLDPESATG